MERTLTEPPIDLYDHRLGDGQRGRHPVLGVLHRPVQCVRPPRAGGSDHFHRPGKSSGQADGRSRVAGGAASPETGVELLRATFQAFNPGDLGACVAGLAPTFVINLAELPGPWHGPETWRQGVEMRRQACPGLRADIEGIVGAVDGGGVRFRFRGARCGGLLGVPAAGRAAGCLGQECCRMPGGRGAGGWVCCGTATAGGLLGGPTGSPRSARRGRPARAGAGVHAPVAGAGGCAGRARRPAAWWPVPAAVPGAAHDGSGGAGAGAGPWSRRAPCPGRADARSPPRVSARPAAD
jgi:predicted ester cyclase